MTFTNQTSTRSRDEIRVFAPWAYYLFTSILLIVAVLFVTIVGRDHNAPRLVVRFLLGVLAGTVLGCYAVLIGYINQDSGRRGMSRVLWTLMAIFVPNGLGNRPLLRLAQTAHRPLSAMRCRGRAGLQLLSPLPEPFAAHVPPLPTQRKPQQQILPLLRRGIGASRGRGSSRDDEPTMSTRLVMGDRSRVLKKYSISSALWIRLTRKY